ncbi:oxygen-binding di-iron domain-containing protein [Caminibacter sp.]
MNYDYSKPIEIAPKIWWVGYVIPNDPFQCHVYLIENGDESILIDPGSMITFPVTLEKIVQVTIYYYASSRP